MQISNDFVRALVYRCGDGGDYCTSKFTKVLVIFIVKHAQSAPVAVRSKVWVCCCLFVGISGSNPAVGMDACLL